MTEKATFKQLNQQVPEQCFQRIESKRTGTGIPDVWGGDCAIELKCTKKMPARASTPVVLDHPLSLAQYRWLCWRWRNGFKSFVVVQINRLGWYLFAAPDAWCLVEGHEIATVQFKLQALWWSPSGIHQVSAMAPFYTLNDWMKETWSSIELLRRDAELNERVKRI